MENSENNFQLELTNKLAEFFDSKLSKLNEKLENDYETLRSLSIAFTGMYHDYNDNILPNVPVKAAPKPSLKDSIDFNKKIQQTPKTARSKTPLRPVPKSAKKDEPEHFEKIEKRRPIKNSTENLKTLERSKTPILNRETDKKENKKEKDLQLNKSTNNLPSLRNNKKIENKEKEKEKEKLNKSINENNSSKNDKLVIKKATDRDINPKQLKRDLTPKPSIKKNVLDRSMDDSKLRKETSKAKNSLRESKDDRKISHLKRNTNFSSTNVIIKGGNGNAPDSTTNSKRATINEKIIKSNDDEVIIEQFRPKVEVIVKLPAKQYLEFSNKNVECLGLMAKNNILPEHLRLKILCSVKEVYNKIGFNKIIKDKISELENRIKIINLNPLSRYLSDNTLESLINKQFNPSKTAQNGLNFVTKDEENNLVKKEQPEEILNVFRLIYILLNEDYKDITPQKIIENLNTKIFAKMGVENISKKNIYFRKFIFKLYFQEYRLIR